MAAHTRLTQEEGEALLRAYGLRLERLEALPSKGTVNSNFRVRASGGQRYFLRVNEGKARGDAEGEAEVVSHLRARGLPTPEILRTLDGAWVASIEGKPVSLFPWVDGVEARPAAPGAPALAGAVLARLHLAGADLAPEAVPRNHYSLAALRGRIDRFAADPRLAPVASLLTEELERAGRRPATRGGLIHQDLFPDNLLVDDEGALAAVIDFEQATSGAWVYDLAVCLNAWCWDGASFSRSALAALRGAYQAIRPLDPDEAAALVAEARLAAARFTITRITDVFLADGVDEDLRRRKDWRDYARRLEFWRAEGS